MSAATGIKRLGIAAAALIAAGFCILAVLSLLISADSVRDSVKSQIRAVTGLDPVLRGDVAVALFPNGTVSFNDVSLGDNRTGASALTAQQLVVRLRFFPLLIGRIEIADVTLVRPTITIAFTAGGGSNWAGHIETLARALQPNAERIASFSEIRIVHGAVILRDETYSIVETLTDVEFALAWPAISKTFAATGRFAWHEQPVDATLTLTDFLAALMGERSGLKLRLNGAPIKFAFDGNFSYRPTFKMEGTLAADTASLRDTLRWAAFWEAPEGGFARFALKAHTNIVGSNISLSGVNVELDGNSGEGVLTFASDRRKTLQGTLAVEGLDLTPYVSTIRLLSGSDRNWSRRQVAFNGLNDVDVDLRLSAARVIVGKARFGRTAVATNLRAGHLTVAVGESQAFGGEVRGSIGLANSPAGAELKAQLQFVDVDLDQALGELVNFRRIEGKGNLTFTLDSSGASVYELTKALNGSVNLISSKGALTGINVEQLLKRLERNPLSSRGDFRSGKTPYDLLSVSIKVTQGTANVETVRIDGPLVRLALSGSASIPARELDLKGVASLMASNARDAEPAFELPFVVTGPWDNPLIWPDAQSLIRRSGAAAPLLDTIRNRLKRDTRPTIEPPAGETVTPPALAGQSQPAPSGQ